MARTITLSISTSTEAKLAKLRESAGLATDRDAIYYAIDNAVPQTTEELISRYAMKDALPKVVNNVTFRRRSDGVIKTLDTPARTLEEAKTLHLPLLELCDIIRYNGVKVES